MGRTLYYVGTDGRAAYWADEGLVYQLEIKNAHQ